MTLKPLTVYVSSTYDDLKEHRAAVVHAIRALPADIIGGAGGEVGGVEEQPLKFTLQKVYVADVFVGILGDRYGAIPDDPDNPDRLSIGELEYREAIRQGRPCLMFVRDPDASARPGAIEAKEEQAKLSAFRERIRQEKVVAMFTTPDDLARRVVASLGVYLQREPDARSAPSPDSGGALDVFVSYNSPDREAVRSIAERLVRDRVRAWMDVIALTPGEAWADATRSAFDRATAVAVFVGASGIGPRQTDEVRAAISRRASEGAERFRVIPVLLPGARRDALPPLLAQYVWVDLGDPWDDRESYERLKSAILGTPLPAPPPRPTPAVAEPDLQMLPQLLFRLVARLRERPDVLHSLEPTAFWAAVRKVQPQASTIDDLRALARDLGGEASPGALWVAWVRHTRATELAALLQHPPPGTA